MSFYELVVKIPHDLEENVPGAADSFVNWLLNKRWELPEGSDLDLDKIDQPQLTLSDKIQRTILTDWRRITRSPGIKYFVQFEKGSCYYHMHVLLEVGDVKSLVVGRYVSQMRKTIVKVVYRDIEPRLPDWMALAKTKTNGANRMRDEGYIPAYLLPKRQPELQWAWTNIQKFERAALNVSERRRVCEEEYADLALSQQSDASQNNYSESAPRRVGRAAFDYMALVKWLVEKGITSERAWMREDSDSYLSYNATGASRAQIKSSLDNACRIMANTKTAADYLIGDEVPEDIEDNRMFRIFKLNGYDPAYAASVLLGWCQRGFGKRNTVWLFGPATTGKTNIAEAIAHSVPFFGCVNWTNENFPFNDCVDKMVIWWEEGKMTAKVVESAKAILGGSIVRVDQKCKSSAQIEQTPVIITSNTNMCEVIDGNSTSFEHRQPLEDRMFKFELLHRLPPDFGKITKAEVRGFFAWAKSVRVEVEPAFSVKKIPALFLKRPRPEGAEPSEAINPGKKARHESFAPETLPEEEPANFALRYVHKCSRHLAMNQMLFPCRNCERMNLNCNICVPHGVSDCTICFPRLEPDGAPEPSVVHDNHDLPVDNWDFYVNLDDKNKEQ